MIHFDTLHKLNPVWEWKVEYILKPHTSAVACVIDLLWLGISIYVFVVCITILHQQAIPILSAFFLCEPFIPYTKFEEILFYAVYMLFVSENLQVYVYFILPN